jgi:hypothetical protein
MYVFDLEVFPNYFLAMFVNTKTETITSFEMENVEELKEFLKQEDLLLIGYNSKHYDSIILSQIISDNVKTCEDIYRLSLHIVSGKARKDETLKKLFYKENSWGDVDLMQIKPPMFSGKVFDWSLKKHQIRMKWKNVQDLPYQYDKNLTSGEKTEVIEYCKNDVLSTSALADNFDELGVFDVALSIKKMYPFVKNKPFYVSHASLGSEIMKTLYRKAANVSYIDRFRKPKEIIFNPKQQINQNITFNNPENIKALEYLKSLPHENVNNIVNVGGRVSNRGCTEWGKKHLKDVRFFAHDVAFRIGVGGIHTDFPQGSHSGNLMDFDVTSYYPSLIAQTKRSPIGLTNEWLDQYLDPYHRRVEFKKQGNKQAADVMKIVINSVYGQLNYPLSDSYDPSFQIQVTLNGQLFLIMLGEMFSNAGFRILSANTDGITIDVGDRKQEAIDVGKQWEEISGHKLEASEYSKYVSRSVNDYFAVKKEGGIKKKGFFVTTSGFSPSVIPDGVIEHFVNGTDIEEFVNSKTNIFDFIYAGQAVKGSVVKWKNEILQRNNRWYKSTKGESIYYFVTRNNEEKRQQLSGSEHCVPVNKIETTEIPNDLDSTFYIEEIKKIIHGIEQELPTTRKDTSELLYHAIKLQDQGLTPQPKGRKYKPKANLPGRIPEEKTEVNLESYPWFLYNGVGVVTGKAFKTVAIDIDNVGRARFSGLFKHTQKSASSAKSVGHRRGRQFSKCMI